MKRVGIEPGHGRPDRYVAIVDGRGVFKVGRAHDRAVGSHPPPDGRDHRHGTSCPVELAQMGVLPPDCQTRATVAEEPSGSPAVHSPLPRHGWDGGDGGLRFLFPNHVGERAVGWPDIGSSTTVSRRPPRVLDRPGHPTQHLTRLVADLETYFPIDRGSLLLGQHQSELRFRDRLCRGRRRQRRQRPRGRGSGSGRHSGRRRACRDRQRQSRPEDAHEITVIMPGSRHRRGLAIRPSPLR